MEDTDSEYQNFIQERYQDELQREHQAQTETAQAAPEDDEDDDYAGCVTDEDPERRADELINEKLRNPPQ